MSEIEFPEVFDNTMLSTFTTCERRFYWFWRRVFPPVEPAYFSFGKAFGVGVNTWHSLQGKGVPFEKRLLLALSEAKREFYKGEFDEEDAANSFENLSQLLLEYAEHYGEEERWKPAYRTGELGFSFPIPGTPWSYGGSLDQPIEWPGYGLMLREDKTTGGYITPSYMEQWDFSTQVAGYLWALQQLLGEVPYGALMNVASKRKRKDPSLRFGRRIVEYSEWKIEEFMVDTVEIIRRMERCFEKNLFPMSGARDPINCVGGMGRSPCSYKSLCLLEKDPLEITDEELEGMGFRLKPEWKPWERKGENEW